MGEDMKHSILFIQKKKHCMKGYKNKRGVTLIELIVTFALISLFTVLSCQLLSTAFGVFYRIQYLNYGMQVSDTLMDKIGGEIEGALVGVTRPGIDNEPDADGEHTLIIRGDSIDFYEKTGSHIKIRSGVPDYKDEYVDKNFNQLVIHYYGVTSVKEGTEVKVIYDAVDWTFDKNMYLGYQIEELTFSQADPTGAEYPQSVIVIKLRLKHSKYGVYESTRYIDCYNFQTQTDFNKIIDEGSSEGDDNLDDESPEDGELEDEGTNDDEKEPSGDGSDRFTVEDVLFKADGSLDKLLEEYIQSIGTQWWKPDGVSVQKTGFYKSRDGYYYVVGGAYYKSNGQVGRFSVKVNQNVILKYENLVDSSNPNNLQWVNKPNVGEVVFYNNAYYMVIGSGVSQGDKPDTLTNWVKLNEFKE